MLTVKIRQCSALRSYKGANNHPIDRAIVALSLPSAVTVTLCLEVCRKNGYFNNISYKNHIGSRSWRWSMVGGRLLLLLLLLTLAWCRWKLPGSILGGIGCHFSWPAIWRLTAIENARRIQQTGNHNLKHQQLVVIASINMADRNFIHLFCSGVQLLNIGYSIWSKECGGSLASSPHTASELWNLKVQSYCTTGLISSTIDRSFVWLPCITISNRDETLIHAIDGWIDRYCHHHPKRTC